MVSSTTAFNFHIPLFATAIKKEEGKTLILVTAASERVLYNLYSVWHLKQIVSIGRTQQLLPLDVVVVVPGSYFFTFVSHFRPRNNGDFRATDQPIPLSIVKQKTYIFRPLQSWSTNDAHLYYIKTSIM